MKKKILLAVVGAMSVFTLAACSGNTNTEIATMKIFMRKQKPIKTVNKLFLI
jgi:uncharacterized lipoprotein YajG